MLPHSTEYRGMPEACRVGKVAGMARVVAKAILMGLCLLIFFAAFVCMLVAGSALTFVVGRWAAKLLGWY